MKSRLAPESKELLPSLQQSEGMVGTNGGEAPLTSALPRGRGKEAKELEDALQNKMADKPPSQLSLTLPGQRVARPASGSRGDEQGRDEQGAESATKTVRVIGLKGIDP